MEVLCSKPQISTWWLPFPSLILACEDQFCSSSRPASWCHCTIDSPQERWSSLQPNGEPLFSIFQHMKCKCLCPGYPYALKGKPRAAPGQSWLGGVLVGKHGLWCSFDFWMGFCHCGLAEPLHHHLHRWEEILLLTLNNSFVNYLVI